MPVVDAPSPTALASRPDARTFSVEDLVGAVRDGRVRVPKFQRPMKWQVDDALELLDSIYRGFPVGTLLFWRRPAEAERIVHQSVVVDAPARADALWVVDGQQRIVSLTRLLAGAGFPDEPFAGFFDLQRERFVRPKEGQEIPAHFVPLTEVLDPERLVSWMRAHPAVDPQKLTVLGMCLRDYQVPAYIVATDHEPVVLEMFRRINSTGKRMEDSEVFGARYGTRGAAEPVHLRDVAASIAELGFGPLEEGVLRDMLLATLGTDLARNRAPELSAADTRRALVDTERVARSAIEFLRRDAGIPHISLLPHTSPLLALARFFYRHPEPHPRSLELLSRWIWRGALTGVHDGDAVELQRILAAIGDDEHDCVQRLLAMLPTRPREPLALDDFSLSHARGKVQVLALLDLGPRNLETGAPVRAGTSGEEIAPLIHTICPHLTAVGNLANCMLHPSVRMGLARALAACDDRAILASHAVPDDARRALALGDEPTFLRLRSAAVQEVLQRFTSRRAQWDEHDRPPIEAMIVGDD